MNSVDSLRVEDNADWVRYGDATLGVRMNLDIPDPEYAEEIVWLYKKAESDYREAIRLDSTDTRSYSQLARLSRVLGSPSVANDNLNKALAVLNKAIRADKGDKDSYSERAEVFEELGDIDNAIEDIERLLLLRHRSWEQ